MWFRWMRTRSTQMKHAIEIMEGAVREKRAENADAETRFRKNLADNKQQLERVPVAAAIIWRGRNG